MVTGLDKFKAHFAGFDRHYVIIGGTAAGQYIENRTTKDIDIILLVEEMSDDFGRRFWEFIEQGDYKLSEKVIGENIKKSVLYRFENPDAGYPPQIELLSKSDELEGYKIIPVSMGENVSRMSAILLDNTYYDYTRANCIVDEGITIASPQALICLKVRAFLNLSEDKKSNPAVRSSEIKKHRDDVFKLLASMPQEFSETVPRPIREAIDDFLDIVEPDQSLRDSLSLNDEAINVLKGMLNANFRVE